MKYLLLATCLFISLMSYGQSRDTVEYIVRLSGHEAGFLKKWPNPDGSYTEWYQYNDRGRGDSTVATYRVNKDHFVVSLDAAGINYYKKPIFEKFYIRNDTAFWQNNLEDKRVKLNGNMQYVALDIGAGGSMMNYLESPDSTLQLLPSGQSKLTVLKEHRLPNGEVVRLVSTKGRGLTPSYFWIDAKAEYLGYPSASFSIMRNGYEGVHEELLNIQSEYSGIYFEEVANKARNKISKGLLITNAKLFDAATGETSDNMSILTEDGKIAKVSSQEITPAADYEVIDADGDFLMPGLWDMHVHYSGPTSGLLHLANGVTNVRDMGNSSKLLKSKRNIEEGVVLGPRIQVMSGFIDGDGEFAGPVGKRINSIEEGEQAIVDYFEQGYQQIKLYSSIKPEWVAPLTAIARKYNLRVSGHIPSFMTATEAINAGYNEIQHMNMLFLNFYGKEIDTRTPDRFKVVADSAAFFDFESEEFLDFIQLLRNKNIAIDPTVNIFEGMFTGEPGQANPSYARILHRLPLSLQRSFKKGPSLDVPKDKKETYERSFSNMLKFLKILYDNDITILAGTDSFSGFALHRELEDYVKAGIPSKEVLKIATLGAASIAGKASEYGSIEKGKVADLILIDGNPLNDITDLTNVKLVVKDNDYYLTKDLFEAVSIEYF